MADTSSPTNGLDGLTQDSSSSSTHLTESDSPQSILSTIQFWLLEAQIILSAISIIYLGAHAALRRPPSAAPPSTKDDDPAKPGQRSKKKHKDEDSVTPGLLPSDAILFPVLAGAMLIGLYYLIQWLQDPEILNRIMRTYMSVMAVASLLTLYSHGVEVLVSFVFPEYWRRWDGKLCRADQETCSVVVCDDAGNPTDHVSTTTSPTPLPFFTLVSSLAGFEKSADLALVKYNIPTASQRTMSVWALRSLLTKEWDLKIKSQHFGSWSTKITIAQPVALFLALATTIVYYYTNSPSLSNMLGYGMCYGSFQILSPTDFPTGAAVLVGLFFYDIIMVFYTPYMVTVATKLDVPIKLTFQTASRKSMLGLGDIVLPGMFMAWVLRLDLWIHYFRKIKYESVDLSIIEKDAESQEVVTRKDTQHIQIKKPYRNVKGSWGDWFWTRRFAFFKSTEQIPAIAEMQFHKVYFYASVAGYILGMLVTLVVLMIYKRGQPALLYLVPGVLGSVLLTAVIRGEFKLLWTYTEDGSLDKEDTVVELDAQGNPLKMLGELKDGVVDTTKDPNAEDEKTADKKEDAKKSEVDGSVKDVDKDMPKKKNRRTVFSLSLEEPSDDEAGSW